MIVILVLRLPPKRQERVREYIQVPDWHDGTVVVDPSRIVDGKRQRKDVSCRDKLVALSDNWTLVPAIKLLLMQPHKI